MRSEQGGVRESRGQSAPTPAWMTWRVMCVCVSFACLAVVFVTIKHYVCY